MLAVPASKAGAAASCIAADPGQLEQAVLEANVILVARVEVGPGGVELIPETFLKGTVSRQTVRPGDAASLPPGCAPANLPDGERVLVFLSTASGTPGWPAASALFRLEGGQAARADGGVEPLGEAELVRRIRTLTGQQAAPPAADEPAAGIDWSGTVLPVGALLLGVFGIGLVLMRTWHRIDPS
jgi:hypothetical protein